MNIAIFSPNQNPYSETFIQAHKLNIKADKLYYIYGSSIESMVVENEGLLIGSHKRLLIKGFSKAININLKPNFSSQAAKRLNSLKIDVALVEYGNHAMKLIETFKKAKIPFVVHFHGYDASVTTIIKQNHNYKELFESASFIIGVSKLMCKWLQDLGCPSSKIVYNVCGANPVFQNLKPNFNQKTVIAIGRFVDKKAPYYTILAFSKVIKAVPDAKLIMAGDGPLLSTCKNLVKYYNLDSHIDICGVLIPEAIKDLMQTSRCFVQHSITAENGNQEGTPVAVMEAALAGLPVISTKHAGIPDVIEHEKTGLLSDEHDVDAMANNIIRVLKDKKFAQELGNEAKRVHKEKYPLSKHIKSIEELLLKSLN